MTGTRSRFNNQQTLTLERLKDFVALDNLTAQIPLIEVSRKGGMRIWTAYDLARVHGTYTEVGPNGLVRTITVYPAGNKHEIINRPAFKLTRVRKAKGLYSAVPNSKRFKTVSKRKAFASSEE
jgi:hypothetical protein